MLFELRDLIYSRGGKHVLDGVSAEIPRGAIAVLGPSGSGKSTLLRLLNRLADPDRGAVIYEGEDVRGRDPLELRREVCLVPQLPALLEGTVEENIAYAAHLGRGGEEPEVPRLLELSGLDPDFAGRDAQRLSVGEQQRVMIARALAVEPRVLLLDEPTSALDERARDAVEATLGELREALELSVVLVTHDLAQAERLAEWTLQIEAGRVISAGPAQADGGG